MRRARRLLPRLLLVAGSCAMSLALAETLIRVLLPAPQRIHVLDVDHEQRLARENAQPLTLQLPPGRQPAVWGGHGLFVATRTGVRLRASTVARIESHRLGHRDTVIRTNSLGYRNPEIGEKTRKRVLFLGDSITFGDWLREEETFVRRVGELSRETSVPLETINAGVSAIGIETELAILMETGLQADPDVVVLCFFLNDVESSRGVTPVVLPPFLARSALARHGARLVSLIRSDSAPAAPEVDRLTEERAWQREMRRIPVDQERWLADVTDRFPPGRGNPKRTPEAFNRRIAKGIDGWGSAWSQGAWRRMEPVFREFARQAEIHGFQFLIVGFPVRLQVEADFVRDYPQRELQRIGKELDVPVLDLLPLIRRLHRESDEALFYDYCHHTPYGNARIAEAILAFIEANAAGQELAIGREHSE